MTATRPVLVALVIAGLGAAVAGQTVAFETVSVRTNTTGDVRMSITVRGRTYSATNSPLRPVVAEAFDLSLQQSRLVGGPSWVGNAPPWPGADRFDILATIPEGGEPRLRQMLQTMLADRFRLAVHRETRESPMFALVLARQDGRLGSRLRKASIDCEALRAAGQTPPRAATDQEPPCSSQIDEAIRGRGQRMAVLARMLIPFAGREVVDRTGLTGGYDFDLRLPQENAGRPPGAGGGADPNEPAGGIFTVLQDELGLKLESIRGPLEFVIIDSIERPAAN